MCHLDQGTCKFIFLKQHVRGELSCDVETSGAKTWRKNLDLRFVKTSVIILQIFVPLSTLHK
jgi:hypothetical protein